MFPPGADDFDINFSVLPYKRRFNVRGMLFPLRERVIMVETLPVFV